MSTAPTRTESSRPREESVGSQPGIRDLKEDVARLRHDATKVASDVADSGLAAARYGMSQASQTGRKVADGFRDSHERMCEYVAANPTTSILVAIGVGALLARILPHR